MLFFLRRDAFGQTVQLIAEVLDLPAGHSALVGIHLRCSHARQSPPGTVEDRGRHLQIAQQGGGLVGGSLRFRWPLGFEKQLGLFEKALADQGRGVAPGGIQLTRLPRITVVLREDGGHPLAVLQADAGHRHQEPHGQVGRDPALAHLLLEGLGEKIHQGQPPRHPTEAAIQAARQLFPSIAVVLLEFGQQPALFQGGLVCRPTQRAIQEQGLGFAHRPENRFHRVVAQLLERRQALVAVDDHVPVRLALGGNHHDGRLLAGLSQRA